MAAAPATLARTASRRPRGPRPARRAANGACDTFPCSTGSGGAQRAPTAPVPSPRLLDGRSGPLRAPRAEGPTAASRVVPVAASTPGPSA